MRRYEFKEMGGYIIRKEAHPTFRNRDGYAKTCYAIYENMEQMNACKPIGRFYSMADFKEYIKAEQKKG